MITMKKTSIDRFEDRYEIITESGCWIWVAGTTKKGYGRFWDKGKHHGANRFSYEHFIGKIPLDYQVCHACDIPSCVNPAHLFVGTQSDNEQDKIKKGRNFEKNKTHCKHGHSISEGGYYLIKGKRRCKKCDNAKSAAYRIKKKLTL